MPDYATSPQKPKEEVQPESVPPKKVEKVVSGAVKVRKKSGFSAFSDLLISKDVNSVKSYIIMDVLIPAFKKAVSDIVRNGIDMILYGETGGKRESSTASRVSYRSYYDKNRSSRDDYGNSAPPPRAKVGYNYDDIVYPDRGAADDVLSRMDELVSTYGIASVADLYDLAGLKGTSTDHNYGWTDISSTPPPVRVRDGYVLKFPAAMPIN